MNPEKITLAENDRVLKLEVSSVIFPYAIKEYHVVGNRIVVRCGTIASKLGPDPDFHFSSDCRNLAAVSHDGDIEWVVSEAPHGLNNEDDPNRYTSIDLVTGRLLATHGNGYRYEIDVANGELSSSYLDTQLPIGDTVVDFSETVSEIVNWDSKLFVRTNRTDDEGGNLFAFEPDGTQLWRSQAYVGSLSVEDDELRGTEPAGGRMWRTYPIDTETGEIGEKEVYSGYPN